MDNENSNMCESAIARDILLITDMESGVKRRVPKLLLECSIRQLHNYINASSYYGGLLGARHKDTIYVLYIFGLFQKCYILQPN